MAMTHQQIERVIAAQNGDIKSFEQLYEAYYEKVYGFARMILKNERDAEDVLQETFITAWRKIRTLHTPATFSVWIQIIAKNLCNMQLRRKNIAILLDAEQNIENFDIPESEELLPAIYAEREDLKERLSKIIDGLSDVQRQTVALYYFNELSVDEISQIMECSPGTVKSRLFLARNTIKTEVEEQERKSGQKFYGVAGLPMLPLGKLIQSHMGSMSIGQSAASASLRVITNSIADSNSMNSVTTVSEKQKIEKGMKMLKNLSLNAKIVGGIAAAATLGAVIVLVAILATGGDNTISPSGDELTPVISSTEPGEETAPGGMPGGDVVYDYNDLSTAVADIPRKEALDEMYILLEGYWITDGDPFVRFFKDETGGHGIEYGLFQTEFGGRGEIIDGHATGKYEADLIIRIPAVPANEMNEAQPERIETIHIDIGGLYQDTTIKVSIENPSISGWHTYKPGGSTLEDAFNNR